MINYNDIFKLESYVRTISNDFQGVAVNIFSNKGSQEKDRRHIPTIEVAENGNYHSNSKRMIFSADELISMDLIKEFEKFSFLDKLSWIIKNKDTIYILIDSKETEYMMTIGLENNIADDIIDKPVFNFSKSIGTENDLRLFFIDIGISFEFV